MKLGVSTRGMCGNNFFDFFNINLLGVGSHDGSRNIKFLLHQRTLLRASDMECSDLTWVIAASNAAAFCAFDYANLVAVLEGPPMELQPNTKSKSHLFFSSGNRFLIEILLFLS